MRKNAVNVENLVLDSGRAEEFNQPLYDRINIATTVPSSVNMFSNPIGANVTLITGAAAATKAKTRRDTNMETAGFIPVKAHEIKGIGIAVYHEDRNNALNAEDRAYVLDGGWLKFTVGGSKTILEIPLSGLPILNDFSSVATTVTATTINALGGPRAPMYKVNPPVAMKPSTNFAIELHWDLAITLNNTLDLQLFLFGGMRRPT
jgi:hypothetical protein